MQIPTPLSILSGHILFTLKTIAMNTQKFLVSGIIGGIVAFFSGFLIYGLLLMDFFTKNAGTATGTMKAQADFVWWALVAGSICQGLLMSYIFNKWANIHSLGAGATAGAVISFFVTAGFDLTMFATSNLSTLTGSCVDIIAGTVMGAIVGGAVGMANGMGSKKTV